eukprot:TCALIF_03490-PA protein Name:"Similar to Tspan11 Tetraspanin-11 (Mus musculus)" AED:0.09 eAED:0.09 QI:0/0/0/0.33/1/1/3/0/288
MDQPLVLKEGRHKVSNMGLRRSDSVKTTLTMYITRSNKYQKWIGSLSVFILLGSLAMIFSGMVFKFSYYMDQLGMLSWSFEAFPWILICVGSVTFITAMAGFVFSATEQRPLLITYAVCMFVLCILQIASVFFANDIRNRMNGDKFSNMNDALLGYPEDLAVKTKWDYLQSRLRCCGVNGYLDYGSIRHLLPGQQCVPDSCCLTSGCNPKCNNAASGRDLYDIFYTFGCRSILHKIYVEDVEILMVLYGILGTIQGMLEMIAAGLALALSAQISRLVADINNKNTSRG